MESAKAISLAIRIALDKGDWFWRKFPWEQKRLEIIHNKLLMHMATEEGKGEWMSSAKKVATWGTFGKDGIDPLKYVRLMDCSTEHLQAILATQPHIDNCKACGFTYREIIKDILKDRGVE